MAINLAEFEWVSCVKIWFIAFSSLSYNLNENKWESVCGGGDCGAFAIPTRAIYIQSNSDEHRARSRTRFHPLFDDNFCVCKNTIFWHNLQSLIMVAVAVATTTHHDTANDASCHH